MEFQKASSRVNSNLRSCNQHKLLHSLFFFSLKLNTFYIGYLGTIMTILFGTTLYSFVPLKFFYLIFLSRHFNYNILFISHSR